MSYPSPSSIWYGETSMDNWYRDTIASNKSLKSIPSNMLYATESAFNRGSMSLPGASFYDETSTSKAMMPGKEGIASRNKYGLRISTNKPLPTLPDDAYFEYLFADADLAEAEFAPQIDEEVQLASPKPTISMCDLLGSPVCSTFEEGSSPPDCQPATPTDVAYDSAYHGYDGTAIRQESPATSTFGAQYVSDNAGSTPFSWLHVNPIVPANNATVPTSNATVANNLVEFDTEEVEAAGATTGFYGGYDVEESPSPYHAPNVDDSAGFGDIRDGCEHFPEQWTHEETQAHVVAPYKLTSSSIESVVFQLPALKPVKPVLQPKSQIAKAARICDMGFGYVHRASYVPQLTELSGFAPEIVQKLNGTKRPAQESVVQSDLDNDTEDEDEEPQSAKKARLSSHYPMDADAAYAPMPSTLSLLSNLKRKTSTASITSEAFENAGALAPTDLGFPGQFPALTPPTRIVNAKFMCAGGDNQFTFGDTIHPNGLFHHTRFQPGGNTEYSEYSLEHSSGVVPSIHGSVGKALKLADESLIVAAKAPRTAEQDALRRETHLECAMARLEGVAVGEYRYYQGHSSIEEYNKGSICICWSECFCTKMCSRYADMLCPCKKHIAFEN